MHARRTRTLSAGPARHLRLATFNLESLDEGPDLRRRIERLRPQLLHLAADILCLQEVNGQRGRKGAGRDFAALDQLLDQTPYARFHRVSTARADGHPADVHNLVILSRLPIAASRQISQDLVDPPVYRPMLARPVSSSAIPIGWDRPMLHATIDLGDGRALEVINLHLRAPRAAPIVGQKVASNHWLSVAGWAEGYYVAAMKRLGQALEARFLVDTIFAQDPSALVVVAGDLNADDHDDPIRMLRGDLDALGDPGLARFLLHSAADIVPPEQRFTVRHRHRPILLDHILLSKSLFAGLEAGGIDNVGLPDEAEVDVPSISGSYHAPLVVRVALPA